MSVHPALTLLSDLLALPSPSGWEAEITAVIQQKITDRGYLPEIDAAGTELQTFDNLLNTLITYISGEPS